MININLLPKDRQAYHAGQKRNSQVLFVGMSLIGTLILISLALFGLTIYNGTVIESEKRSLEQAKDEVRRFSDIEKLVLSVRDRVASLTTQEKNRVPWSEVYDDLNSATPNTVRITQVSMNTTATPHLTISGHADNKSEVASFRERLENAERFETVTLVQVGIGKDEDDEEVTTYSIEANLAGVVPETPPAKKASEEKS